MGDGVYNAVRNEIAMGEHRKQNRPCGSADTLIRIGGFAFVDTRGER